MTTKTMTKEQSDDFERYMECVRGLDEGQVSRLAGREYESVRDMYEELKKEMLIKHERDQKRIAELKQQIAARNSEIARKDDVLDDREGFQVFLTDGMVEIHNIAIERCFRHIANGRRSWQQAGSHVAAENLAFMY